MEEEQTLEGKIQDASLKMPGLRKQLKPYSGGFFNTYFKGGVEDIAYLETDEYKVAASKWDERLWHDDGGGIQWSSKVVLHYIDKNADEEDIKEREMGEVVTRHGDNPDKDRRDLWGYHKIGLEDAGDGKVKAYWLDDQGVRGPTYEADLKDRQGEDA